MKEVRSKVKKNEREEIEFDLPIEKVAYALEISTKELLEAIEENKIRYRQITNQDGSVVIQVEAYARHCTVTVEAKQ
jgi:predicted site-specific integrase-resolvase